MEMFLAWKRLSRQDRPPGGSGFARTGAREERSKLLRVLEACAVVSASLHSAISPIKVVAFATIE